jgi:hypothetical protein
MHGRDGLYGSHSIRPCALWRGGGACMHGTLATAESDLGRLSRAEQSSSIHARKQRLASRETWPMRPRDPMARKKIAYGRTLPCTCGLPTKLRHVGENQDLTRWFRMVFSRSTGQNHSTSAPCRVRSFRTWFFSHGSIRSPLGARSIARWVSFQLISTVLPTYFHGPNHLTRSSREQRHSLRHVGNPT